MAAEAAGNGAPHLLAGPPAGILPPPPHRTSHVQPDPGPSSQPVFNRPLLYVPPPPPLLHYQWPMPFPYNHFGGFPGMGYGMVMPPFPPAPFMEAPAYILPHSHMQPVDYRRLHAPQVPIPGPLLPNPSQTRQGPMSQTVNTRQTVNTEVQTEATQRADVGDEVGSDSGHGTASNSPSPSSTSSRKQTGLEDYLSSTTCTDGQSGRAMDQTVETASQPILRETQEMQKHKGIDQEHTYKKTCEQAQGSAEGLLPVYSASQTEDKTVEGRLVSVPDVLLLRLPQETEQESSRPNKTTLTTGIYEAGESSKILRLPSSPDFRVDEDPVNLVGSVRSYLAYRNSLQHSLRMSIDSPEDDYETSLREDTDEIFHHMSLSSSYLKRHLNESIWSVESLEGFIPNRDWLLQHGMFTPETIVEGEENDPRAEEIVLQRGKEMASSPPVSGGVFERRLAFSTPAESAAQNMSSPSKERDSRAELSPDQVFLTANEPQNQNQVTSVGGTFLIRAGEGEASQGWNEEVENGVGNQLRNKDLQISPAGVRLVEVSPSKGPSVDCGIQSTELCACGMLIDCKGSNQLHPNNHSEVKKATDTKEVTDGRLTKSSRRNANWRSRIQERNGAQQEVYGGGCFKPGKPKGGNGRNSRN